MGYECKILLDSISETNKRLTTFQITFPRIVLSEFNTHRMFSRNSASSRAIPLSKQIERIINDPFIPEQFPLNCSGMQPQEYITKDHKDYQSHKNRWLYKRSIAIEQARDEAENWKWHKQLISRPLEAFMYHTVICTATEFDNFFKLRCDENAQYEIRRIADLMYEAYYESNEFGDGPKLAKKLKVGEWHCPLVDEGDFKSIMLYLSSDKELDEPNAKDWKSYSSLECESWNDGSAEAILDAYTKIIKKISVARCARVSYLTHDGKRDIEKDLELFERLRTSGHWSPFEHVATPYFSKVGEVSAASAIYPDMGEGNRYYLDYGSGNFRGWKQFRKEFQDENCTHFRKGE